MIPITLTVYDKNIAADETILRNTIDIESHTRSLNPTTTENTSFPSNIKYIFEEEPDPPHEETFDVPENDCIENVIVVNLDDTHDVKSVELLSDNFELLSFYKENASEDEQGLTGTDPNTQGDMNQPGQVCIGLDVLSKFKHSESLEKLPLKELITLYNMQNEQMQKLSNSI